MDASPELFVTLPTGKRRVRICYQTFGNPSDPAVVFIAGHGCSMLDWREEMLELFSPANDRHFLIRYDHRDTGLSSEFPVPGGYNLSDMTGDIEGLVDHLGLSSKGFHIVGASMGGPISWDLAARRPEQAKSLTLLLTSPGACEELPLNDGIANSETGVLPMLGGIGNERAKYIQYGIDMYNRLSTRPLEGEEKKEVEAHVARITDRDMRGGTLYSKAPNHGEATGQGWPRAKLQDVKCPTTVLQAAKDQFFGVIHGETLAKEIPDAEYVLWDDIGHEFPKRVWNRLAEVLLRTWKKGEN